jgi:hypothetical protein
MAYLREKERLAGLAAPGQFGVMGVNGVP